MSFGFLTHIKKAAVSALLAGALLTFGPSFASATTEDAKPSDGFSVVDRGSMPANLDKTLSSNRTDASVQATFDCYYTQGPSDLWLDCVIYDGALQFVLFCSDGNIYPSPWFGAGSWLIHGWCTPALLNYWGVNQI